MSSRPRARLAGGAIGAILLVPLLSAHAYAAPTNETETFEFPQLRAVGSDVALSRDLAVIGAGGTNSTSSGAVVVMRRNGADWVQEAELRPEGLEPGDRFGDAVAVFGRRIVASSQREDNRAGAVYVFVEQAGIWTQEARLVASDRTDGDFFGKSISIEGPTIVVGAYVDDEGGGPTGGSAYVFERTGQNWAELQKLRLDDAANLDHFGVGVDISGDTIVVGANFRDSRSGAAYVYRRSAGVWNLETELKAPDATNGFRFGRSVAIDGDTVVVGSNRVPVYATASGAAYVFERTGTTWDVGVQIIPPSGGANDQFGVDVDISKNRVLVGAKWFDDGADDSGAAFVFVKRPTGWVLTERIRPSTQQASAYFGTSLALRGSEALVGAPGLEALTNGGAAYLFGL